MIKKLHQLNQIRNKSRLPLIIREVPCLMRHYIANLANENLVLGEVQQYHNDLFG